MGVMVIRIFISLLVLAWAVCGGASAENEIPSRELRVSNDDVTLHVRIRGNPGNSNILVIVNGGPGMSSKHVLGLERLAGAQLTVVTYDQRGTGKRN